jgi:hypothetical protein
MRVEKHANGLYQAKLALQENYNLNAELETVSGNLFSTISSASANISNIVKNVGNAVSSSTVGLTESAAWTSLCETTITTTKANSKILAIGTNSGYLGGSTNACTAQTGLGWVLGANIFILTPVAIAEVRADQNFSASDWDAFGMAGSYVFTAATQGTYTIKTYARLNSGNGITMSNNLATIFAMEIFT